MIIDLGCSCSRIAWRYCIIRLPSTCTFGKSRAWAPVAIINCLAVTVRGGTFGLKSDGPTCSVFASVKVPWPSITSILFLRIRKPTPLVWRSTMPRLRFTALLKSTCKLSKVKPYSAALFNVSRTSAFLSNAFLGIQPQFKQTPPKFSRSTMAVFKPNCAARIAAT